MARVTKINSGIETPIDINAEKAARYLDLQAKIDAFKANIEPLKAEQKVIEDYFLQNLDDRQKLTTSAGIVEKAVTNAYKVIPSFIEKLKKEFGGQYSTFVTENVSYGASAAFKAILKNEQDKYFKIASKAIEITCSRSIKVKPLK